MARPALPHAHAIAVPLGVLVALGALLQLSTTAKLVSAYGAPVSAPPPHVLECAFDGDRLGLRMRVTGAPRALTHALHADASHTQAHSAATHARQFEVAASVGAGSRRVSRALGSGSRRDSGSTTQERRPYTCHASPHMTFGDGDAVLLPGDVLLSVNGRRVAELVEHARRTLHEADVEAARAHIGSGGDSLTGAWTLSDLRRVLAAQPRPLRATFVRVARPVQQETLWWPGIRATTAWSEAASASASAEPPSDGAGSRASGGSSQLQRTSSASAHTRDAHAGKGGWAVVDPDATPSTTSGGGKESQLQLPLSAGPHVVLMRGFVSDAEADHIVSLATRHPRFNTSLPFNSVYFTYGQERRDSVLRAVEERIAAVTGSPIHPDEEALCVHRILPSDAALNINDYHHDKVRGAVSGGDAAAGRMVAEPLLFTQHAPRPRPHDAWNVCQVNKPYTSATVLVYLSTVEEGGHTTFPCVGHGPAAASPQWDTGAAAVGTSSGGQHRAPFPVLPQVVATPEAAVTEAKQALGRASSEQVGTTVPRPDWPDRFLNFGQDLAPSTVPAAPLCQRLFEQGLRWFDGTRRVIDGEVQVRSGATCPLEPRLHTAGGHAGPSSHGHWLSPPPWICCDNDTTTAVRARVTRSRDQPQRRVSRRVLPAAGPLPRSVRRQQHCRCPACGTEEGRRHHVPP